MYKEKIGVVVPTYKSKEHIISHINGIPKWIDTIIIIDDKCPENTGVLVQDTDVVYGSRFMGGNIHRILFFWHSLGNKFLTILSNMFTNLNLSDMETCYKLFKTYMLKSLSLNEKHFGFEPEITAKNFRVPKVRVYEVGISNYGSTYEDGKIIGWQNGTRAIYSIIKYNLFFK